MGIVQRPLSHITPSERRASPTRRRRGALSPHHAIDAGAASSTSSRPRWSGDADAAPEPPARGRGRGGAGQMSEAHSRTRAGARFWIRPRSGLISASRALQSACMPAPSPRATRGAELCGPAALMVVICLTTMLWREGRYARRCLSLSRLASYFLSLSRERTCLEFVTGRLQPQRPSTRTKPAACSLPLRGDGAVGRCAA